VAQTFFIDEELRERYILDGIITLVDAAHAELHLTQTIAQAQIGLPTAAGEQDRPGGAARSGLRERLTRINRRARFVWSSTAASTWPNCSMCAVSTSTRPG
jgi:G3E family GTPase